MVEDPTLKTGTARCCLEIQVQPLIGWQKGNHEAGVRREAETVAQHLGLETLDVTILA